jgi:hypothetical protein
MYISTHIQLIQGTNIIIVCTGVFSFVAFIFLITILFSRVLKNNRARRFDKLQEEFQKTLNALIILEHSKENLSFSLDYHLKNLMQKIRTSFGKQLLIDQIMSNKVNLKGSSAIILRTVYIRLGLKKLSISKLNYRPQLKVVQALHELAEMECVDSISAIQKLLHHRQLVIRRECFITLVRLSGSFASVASYKGMITPWMQLTIYRHLSMLPSDRLPKFHTWFRSPNRDIRKLAITMAHHFRQTEAVPGLSQLLYDDDLEIAGLAITCLGDMGAVEYSNAIAGVGRNNPFDESISSKVIRALGQIGNGEHHAAFLAWHMVHSSDTLRLQAMTAMQALNLNCRDFLIDFNAQNDNAFESLFAHVTEPLLQS